MAMVPVMMMIVALRHALLLPCNGNTIVGEARRNTARVAFPRPRSHGKLPR
jgi:hypothetical protein